MYIPPWSSGWFTGVHDVAISGFLGSVENKLFYIAVLLTHRRYTLFIPGYRLLNRKILAKVWIGLGHGTKIVGKRVHTFHRVLISNSNSS